MILAYLKDVLATSFATMEEEANARSVEASQYDIHIPEVGNLGGGRVHTFSHKILWVALLRLRVPIRNISSNHPNCLLPLVRMRALCVALLVDIVQSPSLLLLLLRLLAFRWRHRICTYDPCCLPVLVYPHLVCPILQRLHEVAAEARSASGGIFKRCRCAQMNITYRSDAQATAALTAAAEFGWRVVELDLAALCSHGTVWVALFGCFRLFAFAFALRSATSGFFNGLLDLDIGLFDHILVAVSQKSRIDGLIAVVMMYYDLTC